MTISTRQLDPFGGFDKVQHVLKDGDRVRVLHNGYWHRGKVSGGDGTHHRVELDSGHVVIAHHLDVEPEDFPTGEATKREAVERVQKTAAAYNPFPLDGEPLSKASASRKPNLRIGQRIRLSDGRVVTVTKVADCVHYKFADGSGMATLGSVEPLD